MASGVLPFILGLAVVLLAGCGIEDAINRQPLPVGNPPVVTLAPIARPYPDRSLFSTTTSTDPPCDLTPHLCGLDASAFSDD